MRGEAVVSALIPGGYVSAPGLMSYSLQPTHCCLLTIAYLLLPAYYRLLTAACSLLPTHYSLLTTHYIRPETVVRNSSEYVVSVSGQMW